MNEELRSLLRDAIRKAYLTMQEAHGDENFYVFALQTDCDVSTVTGVGNTREAMMRQAEESGDLEWVMEEFEDTDDFDEADVFSHLDPEVKWAPAEWEYWDEEGCFEPVNRLLGEKGGSDGREDFVAWKTGVLETFGRALQDLRDDGTFDASMALIVSVADYGPDEAKPMERVTKQLNEGTVYRDLLAYYDNL